MVIKPSYCDFSDTDTAHLWWKKGKSPWLTRLISIGWIIGVIVVQTVVMFFIAISKPLLDEVINFFPTTRELIEVIEKAQWPVVIIVLLLGVMLINYAMPAKRPHWRALLAGSTIEVAAFLALTQVFGLYVKIAANKYTFYQAVGSIIIMLIWLNLVAMISLLGPCLWRRLTKFGDHAMMKPAQWVWQPRPMSQLMCSH